MKNFNLIRHLKFRIKPSTLSQQLARSKNDWESSKIHPYNPVDEHTPPTNEDIVKEYFDKNYFKFGFKSRMSDHHEKEDMFNKYREFQHLYIHPKEPFLGWTDGSVIVKYLYFFLPAFIFIFFIYLEPVKSTKLILKCRYLTEKKLEEVMFKDLTPNINKFRKI